MRKNIYLQLEEMMSLFEDYPGVENILDIAKAKDFLTKLSKSKIAHTPSFEDVDSEKIKEFVVEQETLVQEWKNAIKNLNGVYIQDPTDDENEVFWGLIEPDLAAMCAEEGSGGSELTFEFLNDNKATFEKEKGTWEEIYFLILKHVKEKLTAPDLPSEDPLEILDRLDKEGNLSKESRNNIINSL